MSNAFLLYKSLRASFSVYYTIKFVAIVLVFNREQSEIVSRGNSGKHAL